MSKEEGKPLSKGAVLFFVNTNLTFLGFGVLLEVMSEGVLRLAVPSMKKYRWFNFEYK